MEKTFQVLFTEVVGWGVMGVGGRVGEGGGESGGRNEAQHKLYLLL